jgi:hypothetical protein
MVVDEGFRDHIASEIGSMALPALRQYLVDRDYRLASYTEDVGGFSRDVYHPERGLFRAAGEDDTEALLGILRQIWLVDGLGNAQEAGIGHCE